MQYPPVDPGLSPGTISAESFIFRPGSELVSEVGLNTDGTVNTAKSDSIVVTTGGKIDLSEGSVTLELSSADPNTTLDKILDDIVSSGEVPSISAEDLFEEQGDCIQYVNTGK